jgi:cadmium resistance protein CadD (predicted permease)
MNTMVWLGGTLLAGLGAFAATNIDDLCALILLFSDSSFSRRDIMLGHYLGFLVIISVSTIGFFVQSTVALPIIGALGIVPLTMGLVNGRKLWLYGFTSLRQNYRQEVIPTWVPAQSETGHNPLFGRRTYIVMAITIGNGFDNISAYTVLFAAGNFVQLCVLIGLFAVLVGIWCYMGYTLVRLKPVQRILTYSRPVLLPLLLVLLGFYILAKAGTLGILWETIRRVHSLK